MEGGQSEPVLRGRHPEERGRPQEHSPGAVPRDRPSLASSTPAPVPTDPDRPLALTQHGEREPPLGPADHVLGHAAVASGVGGPRPLHVQAVAPVLRPQARLGPHRLAVSLPRHPGWRVPCGVAFQRGRPVLDHGDLCVGLPGAGDLRRGWVGRSMSRGSCCGRAGSHRGLRSVLPLTGPMTLAGWPHPSGPPVVVTVPRGPLSPTLGSWGWGA